TYINKKLKEKKHFIYVVFAYRKGKIIFFSLCKFLLPAFVEASAAKNPMLNCLPAFFAVLRLL
ncbi:hypothetical protein KKB07_00530, partial [bacterium]|nr:hypothetical protein [bacterium]